MAQTYKTEGIILSRRPHREKDKLVNVFTRDYGKLTARAISAKKITSKLSGHLEPFTRTDMHLARSKTIDIVAGSNTLNAHKQLRTSLPHAAMAGFFAEVVDAFTHSGQVDEDVYDHVAGFYEWLNDNDPHLLVLYVALMQLFSVLGFHTDWYRCHSCKRTLPEKGSKFHFALWNVECVDCKSTEETMPLSKDAIKILRFIQQQSFQEVRRLIIPQSVWEEVHTCMHSIIRYHHQFPLRSERLLLDVEKLNR